jgi:DNA/RNA-binding domain of Phe-tRNA-synthetase-like protein
MIRLAPDLGTIVRPAVLAVADAVIAATEPRLDSPLAEAERRVREHPPEQREDVRAMYRATGVDPTRRRPSSEALLRRVLHGEALPRINAAVDVCNWCSLEFQLPYGLYDLDRIHGEVELRRGAEGEQYPGIRKDTVHVGGRLVLADARGPFGNPSSDSARTMVQPGASRLLVVVYAPARLPAARLSAVLDATASRLLQFTGGRETARLVV